MKGVKIIKLGVNDIPQYLELGSKEQPCILYGIHEAPFVWICKEGKCNKDTINDMGLSSFEIKNGVGSTIVCAKGDIDIGFFGTKDFCFTQLQKIIELYSKKICNFEMINNDFMYDDKKYGAMTFCDLGECWYVGVHISNNIEKELISAICQKNSFKIPDQLPNIISEEELLTMWRGVELWK